MNPITSHPDCKMQGPWAEQNLRNQQYDAHIKEGERQGGHRDRLAKVEVEVNAIIESQRRMIIYVCIAGFIGGLLGKVIPELALVVGRMFGFN